MPFRLLAVSRQTASNEANHELQAVRGLIERKFAALRQWRYLDSNRLSQINTVEAMLDILMALENFKVLSKSGRLAEKLTHQGLLPRNPPRSTHLRNISNMQEKVHFIPTPLSPPQLLQKAPHLQQVRDFLSSTLSELRENLKVRVEMAKRSGAGAPMYDPTPSKRGESLAKGGAVLHVQFGVSPNETLLIMGKVGASYHQDAYTVIMEVTKKVGITAHQCSCSYGMHRCSHSKALLSLIVRFGERDESLMVGCRRTGKQKPDKTLRFVPLVNVLDELDVSANSLCIHPDPICKYVPPLYCICRKKRKAKSERGQMIQCRCLEWFHFKCICLPSDFNLDGEFVCGFCYGQEDVDLLEQEWDEKHMPLHDRVKPKKRGRMPVKRWTKR